MRALSSAPTSSTALDLDAYLARVGYAGSRAATHATLDALHFAHTTQIPFENVDVLLRRPIRLELEALQAKLVTARRGGYCFEHNVLFRAVLERLGFPVTTLAARVLREASGGFAGIHAFLRVECDGAAWLADVGYGGAGPLRPIPFVPGRRSTPTAALGLVSGST